MNKKEFYEAPEWGTRVVMVERHYLQNDSLVYGNNDEAGGELEEGNNYNL